MPSHPKASKLLPLEPEIVAALESMWHEQIGFDRVLGVQLAEISPEHASSRVGTTRMEFCAEDGKLLATGTSAYIVS